MGHPVLVHRERPLNVVFYRTESGQEPVRDWLSGLARKDKKILGGDIKTVQYGWPYRDAGGEEIAKKSLGNTFQFRQTHCTNYFYAG